MINDVLRDMLNHFIFVYLDDILIFSRSLPEHTQHVRQVLQRLLENQLFVKAEKCEFHVSKVSFLGFIIAPGQLHPDPSKIKAVENCPTPSTRKKQFLGFANFYHRFIHNYMDPHLLNSVVTLAFVGPSFLLQQRFWWPRMAQDTQEYINACSVCARGKSSHRAPAGFLKPLPIPHHPWSHIAVDFRLWSPTIPRRRTHGCSLRSRPTSAGTPLEPLWFVLPLAAGSKGVWLSSRDLPLQVPSHKLAPRYIRPYVVEKIINPSSVRLKLPPSLRIHPNLPRLPPQAFHFLVSFARPPTPLLPQLIDGHPAYLAKEVLDVRRRGRGYQYLVDWEGYGPEERSWISRKLILGDVLLIDFFSKHPDKPGRPPGGVC
ncbi:hypothetical protein L3Q82_025062 [Scortum barcoo]|uniref:Uncharacterized protein n=1 Tax=Scortum barcoo TaxID=214431 RepID=A0ACB8WR19_9TELE|nr:hypothetical protein L3Q82_025062 [Scortum barcoo]